MWNIHRKPGEVLDLGGVERTARDFCGERPFFSNHLDCPLAPPADAMYCAGTVCGGWLSPDLGGVSRLEWVDQGPVR